MQRRKVQSREDVTMNKNTANSLCSGDIRLRNVRRTLDSVGIIRSSDQISFHEAFIAACLPKSKINDITHMCIYIFREFSDAWVLFLLVYFACV